MAAEAEAAREARAKVFNPFENLDFKNFSKIQIKKENGLISTPDRKISYSSPFFTQINVKYVIFRSFISFFFQVSSN